MSMRPVIIILATMILFIVGCRTGEYNVDLEIYELMPDLLAIDPELEGKLWINDDGSIKVEFEKGEMYLYFEHGLDEGRRRETASRALEIFHEVYMNHPDNLRKDGTFYRQVISLRGYVDEIELYVIEWDLSEERPNVRNDRYGNFI